VLGGGRVDVATSSDGGNTWTCGSYTDDYGGNHVTGIGFVSENIAVMCFDTMYEHDLLADNEMTLPIVLSRTVDGGKTWKRTEIAAPDGWENYRTRPSVPVFDGTVGQLAVTRYDKTTGNEVDTVYLITSDAGLTWEWEGTSQSASIEDIFYSVLEDKTLVYSLSAEDGMYLSELFQSHRDTHPIIKYSIIDLNGDGASELVFIKSSGNYTILHVEGKKVYANSLAYRSFMDLKEDGTFIWSGGASDWGIGRIDFDRYNHIRENLAFCRYDYDNKAEVYSVENRDVSKEEFDAYYAAQDQKPEAVWYAWTAYEESFNETDKLNGEANRSLQFYQSVLHNETPIYFVGMKQEILLQDYLDTYDYYDDVHLTVKKYAVVDFESDNNPEMVLWLDLGGNDSVGYNVLHFEDGIVYGYGFPYRGLQDLKTDGTFRWSGGAAHHGIAKIVFSKDTYTETNLAYCENTTDHQTVYYYMGDKAVSSEDFHNFCEIQNEKDSVVWVELSVWQEETSTPIVDLNSIGGDWYHSFRVDGWYAFYRLNINNKKVEMQFDHGLYESEYANRYSGSYSVDTVTQEITAVLHDSSSMHSDPDITLKFKLESHTEPNDTTLVMHILSCNVAKYQHLVGQSMEFTREFGYTALQYQDALDYYQMWYEQKLTGEELLSKAAAITDILKEIKTVTGIDLNTVHFTREYHPEEDRFPFQFFFNDDIGTKIIGVDIIKYTDKADGELKFGVEVNPKVLTVE